MKAFKTTLTDGRIFYVTHYTKGEAVACFESETGISRTEVDNIQRTTNTFGDDTIGVVMGEDNND